MSIKDQLLAVEDRIFEEVDVPEWNLKLRLYEMSGEERSDYERAIFEVKGEKMEVRRDNTRARLLVQCLYDTEGHKLFSNADIDALGKKSGRVLDRLYNIADRINGLSRTAQQELEKN